MTNTIIKKIIILKHKGVVKGNIKLNLFNYNLSVDVDCKNSGYVGININNQIFFFDENKKSVKAIVKENHLFAYALIINNLKEIVALGSTEGTNVDYNLKEKIVINFNLDKPHLNLNDNLHTTIATNLNNSSSYVENISIDSKNSIKEFNSWQSDKNIFNTIEKNPSIKTQSYGNISNTVLNNASRLPNSLNITHETIDCLQCVNSIPSKNKPTIEIHKQKPAINAYDTLISNVQPENVNCKTPSSNNAKDNQNRKSICNTYQSVNTAIDNMFTDNKDKTLKSTNSNFSYELENTSNIINNISMDFSNNINENSADENSTESTLNELSQTNDIQSINCEHNTETNSLKNNILNFEQIKPTTKTVRKYTIKNPFYKAVEKQLNNLFKTEKRCNKLEKLIPFSKWVELPFDETNNYVVGVIYEDSIPQFICYGVPSESELDNLSAMSQYFRIPNEDDGYYMMYQDAVSGNTITDVI